MTFSLKTKAAAAITIMILVTAAIIATVQTRFIRSGLVDRASTMHAALVAGAARNLDQKLETALLALTREAQVIPAVILARPQDIPTYLERQAAMLLIFDALLVFSPTGEVLGDAPLIAGRRGLQAGEREYIKRGIATLKPTVSMPYLGRGTRRPIVTMIAPILDPQGRLAGFLGGNLDLLKSNLLGSLAATRIGRDGYFFAITRQQPSVYISHPDQSLVLTSSLAEGAGSANAQALAGREGTIQAADSEGNASLYSYKALGAADWVLGTSYPMAEALAPVSAAEQRLWTISGILVLVLAPFAWLLTWYLIAPLLRLRDDAQRLRRMPGTICQDLRARQDEIGDLARDFHDLIVARQQSAEAQRRATQLLDNIVENIPVGIQLKAVDDDFRVVMWNKASEAIWGLPRDRVIGHTAHDFWSAEEIERYRRADLDAVAARGQEFTNRPGMAADGKAIITHMRKVPLFDAAGVATHLLIIADDVTARREVEHEMQASERRLRTITDTMPAWVAFLDRDETYRFTNKAFERAFGLTHEQMRGRTIREVLGEAEYEKVKPYLGQVFGGHAVTFEREQLVAAGLRWVEATWIPEFDGDAGEVVGFHAMLRDVTGQKREEQRLLRLSQVDSLTGLANRVGFEQHLSDAMAESRNTRQALAVMYLDIDHFKRINDTHGHAAGDALLLALAQRLKGSLRKTDLVARLGGDEFVAVLERMHDPRAAARLADKALHAIRRPFVLTEIGIALSITASIGIAFFDGGEMAAGQLVADADAMLYDAKKRGRDKVCLSTWPDGAGIAAATVH